MRASKGVCRCVHPYCSLPLARDLQVLKRESSLRGDGAGAVVEVDLDEEGRPGLAPQGEGLVGRVPVPALHHRLLR